MLEKGWQPDGYSYYEGEYRYHKYADIRTVLDYIVIKLKKKTDDRDRTEFGFTEPITRGGFKYPIPEDLREEIARNVFDNIANEEKLSGTVREKIIQMASPDILEKEFKGLLELKNELKEAMPKAIDSSLSAKEQKDRIREVVRDIERRNPACINLSGCRSLQIIDSFYRTIYAQLGFET